MIRVDVEQGELQGFSLEIAGDITFGRAADNVVRLPDWHVSSRHAVLRTEGSRVIFRDLGSTNGSRVLRGDSLVNVDVSCQYELELQAGDRLALGDPKSPVVVRVFSELWAQIRGAVPAADEAPRESHEPDARVVAQRPVSAMADVRRSVETDRTLLGSLYEVTRAMSGALAMSDVLDAVAGAVFSVLPRATHMTVVLRDESVTGARAAHDGYVPVTTRVRGEPGQPIEAVPIARSVFRKVLTQRAAVLVADAQQDLAGTASILGASILSTMAAPLWKGEEILGVLEVDNRNSPGIFGERDLDVLMLLAASASLAIANARLYRKVQQGEASAKAEAGYLKQTAQKKFEGIIGESAAMKAMFSQLSKVIETRVTVLIEGETGTGKERVASAIHYQSQRRDKLFIAQNCAALPESLLESELFGHKRGAFTGADSDKKGLFELADGGTMFLDEIGEMPLTLQSKLLRVLQEGEIRPLGSPTTRSIDVRIVAATNRKLEDEVKEGRFRQDLYYRLQVFPIRLPTLRERRDDIPLLARHFLDKYSREMGKPIAGFSQQTLELMMSYGWPGNVREVENEVQRLVIQTDPGSYLLPHDLSARIRNVEGVLDKVRPPRGTLKEMIEHIEKWLLIEALREHKGNKSATAKTLGITREGLHKKLKGFGIG
ncbi:MAG: sigma 54-interacting transcriptional regulator [Deltaproteobacteria bacterium]|nr:sigma 54-interacting transcriptional regulator [Deltaproteobacteria bacterium]